MDFLVDASLPRTTSAIIVQHGHTAVDVRDIGLGDAADPVVSQYAQLNRMCLITRDHDFGNIRDYPPEQYHGLVVIQTSSSGTKAEALSLVAALLGQPEILRSLAGRLAIVDGDRIRLRPPLV